MLRLCGKHGLKNIWRVKKIRKIRVTQVLGCPRAYQYSLENRERLPPHFYNMKGTLIHSIIEKYFKHQPLPDYDLLIKDMQVEIGSYLENQLFATLTLLMENFKKWLKKTKIDLSDDMILGVEKELRMPIKDDYYLVGHIDLITKTHIIDFKSSLIGKRTEYWKQLGAYRELAKYNGLQDLTLSGDWQLVNVFLRDTEPLEYGPSIYQIEKLMPSYFDRLFRFIEYDKRLRENKKFMAPAEIGWHCQFCDWRGHPCRGI